MSSLHPIRFGIIIAHRCCSAASARLDQRVVMFSSEYKKKPQTATSITTSECAPRFALLHQPTRSRCMWIWIHSHIEPVLSGDFDMQPDAEEEQRAKFQEMRFHECSSLGMLAAKAWTNHGCSGVGFLPVSMAALPSFAENKYLMFVNKAHLTTLGHIGRWRHNSSTSDSLCTKRKQRDLIKPFALLHFYNDENFRKT